MAILALTVQPIGINFGGFLQRLLPSGLFRPSAIEIVSTRCSVRRAADVVTRFPAVGDRLEVVVVVLVGNKSDRAHVRHASECGQIIVLIPNDKIFCIFTDFIRAF